MDTEKMKDAIERFMDEVCRFSDIARKEGLLALETYLDREKVLGRDIFHYGMVLVMHGLDADYIEEILTSLMVDMNDMENITIAVIKRKAVLSIYRGDNSDLIRLFMDSLVPELLRSPHVHTEFARIMDRYSKYTTPPSPQPR